MMKIIPCPFCGDKMENATGMVQHKNQGSCIIGAQSFDELQINRWNRRDWNGAGKASAAPYTSAED